MALEPRDVRSNAARWAKAHYGDGAEIVGLSRMPGHSGISYLLRVQTSEMVDELVMRVPPAGVRQQANLDVVRLAPVLELAQSGGVPVPAVRWYSDDDIWFGTPYLMVSCVEGSPLPDVFESGQHYPARDRVDDIFQQAVEALAAIHRLDPSRLVEQKWAVPASRQEDILQWRGLLQKSEVPEEFRRTEELGQLLLASAPPEVSPRIVHGDFYSNNWMLDGDRLTAVLDWENTTLNDPGWDLGWMSAIYDPECWGPSRAPGMTWHPGPEDFYGWYEQSMGASVVRPHWYHALMCYRLAAITPAKVRLHRTGRRVDEVWEVFAEAIPYQLDKAFRLLQEDR